MKGDKVLVVLFGWMGAHPKHVQKYADWWAGLGCDTMLVCGTPLSTFYGSKTKQVALSMVKRMQEYVDKNPDCSIIFHGFSNGGGFIIAQVCHILEEKKHARVRDCVKFNVLDSLLDVYIVSALRAFNALNLSIFVNIFFYMLFPFIALFGYLTNFFPSNMSAYTLRKTPTLVLYSTADSICKPHEIEFFVSHLCAHAIPTTTHKFHESSHVNHFRKYPDEYAHLVLQFLASNGLHLGS